LYQRKAPNEKRKLRKGFLKKPNLERRGSKIKKEKGGLSGKEASPIEKAENDA